MQYFLKLIEIAKNDGVVIADFDPVTGKKRAYYEPMDDMGVMAMTKCQPFVFSEGEPFDEKNNGVLAPITGLREDGELDAPFQVFSIECLNGPLSTFMNPEGPQETYCVVVKEFSPKVYGFYALTKGISNQNDGWAVWSSNAEGPTVKHFLNRLSREQTGCESVRHVIKLRTSNGKISHRIRRIVHVVPKKKTIHYDNGRHIDWTHRFNVRGHWRTAEGLGKDREGNYCIPGLTWVIDHVKGPEHLPLVKKTRIVI